MLGVGIEILTVFCSLMLGPIIALVNSRCIELCLQRFNIVNGVVDVESQAATEIPETNATAEKNDSEGIVFCTLIYVSIGTI